MDKLCQKTPGNSRENPQQRHSLTDRYLAKAIVATLTGRDHRRYIARARAAARREEFEQTFERAQGELRKAARV